MVSLWPWKKGNDDTASFEKALSSISAKISKAKATRDKLRTHSRRYKALWTIYTGLAYLLASLILILVTGWQNWGPVEYTVVAGGPVLIYLVRMALTSFYGYRISSTQAHLDHLNQQREEEIEKFKKATKYNTTQQLLEKYGAEQPSPSASNKKETPVSTHRSQQAGASSSSQGAPHEQQPVKRTGIAPPPTANIRRADAVPAPVPQPPSPQPVQASSTDARSQPQTAYAAFQQGDPAAGLAHPPSPSAEFAPNAYDAGAPAGEGDSERAQWYDRLMDLLLGEDETRASNRLALICAHCRLVNGQAPPGTRTLEDVGRWRCGGCGAWNGVDRASEVTRIVREAAAAGDADGDASADSETMLRQAVHGDEAGDEDTAEEGVASQSEGAEEEGGADSPPARSTRSQRSSMRKRVG